MTSTEIKTRLHERIEQLNENQLKQLRDLVNEKFPEEETIQKPKKKRKLGTMKGKIRLADDWDSEETNEEIARTFYESEIFPKNEQSFRPLSITHEHVKGLEKLSPIHKDPFDRILIAQAIAEDLTLITRDKKILQYPDIKILKA